MGRAVKFEAVIRTIGPHVYLAVPFVIVALLFSRAVADIACVLLGLGLIAYSAHRKNWDWLKDPVVAVALVMMVYFVLIVAPLSLDFGRSFVSGFVWIRFIVFYAAIVAIISANPSRVPTIAVLSIAVLALAGSDAMYQYFSGVSLSGHSHPGRLTGPLDRPNIGSFLAKFGFASFALLAAAMPFVKVGGTQRAKKIVVTGLAGLLLFLVIVLSRERTATILTIFCLVVLVPGFLAIDGRYRKWAVSLAAGCGAVVVGLVALLPTLQSRLVQLVADLSNLGDTPYGQLITATAAVARAHPLTGIGFKQFAAFCEGLRADGVVNFCSIHPHNPYLDVQVVGGAFGSVLFVLMVGALVFKFLRAAIIAEQRLVAALGLSAVIMTMFPFMFSQSFFSNWPGIVAWLSIAIAVGSLKAVGNTSR